MAEERKRHCWECLRRSLVCDFTRPGCKRCAASGTACPGYGDKRPVRLRWLEPGKVKSRKAKGRSNQGAKKQTPPKQVSSPEDDASAEAPLVEMKTDVHAYVEATEYFNACIYPILLEITKLGKHTSIYPITPRIFQNALAIHPDHIRLVIVCMTLSHRINRMRNGPESRPIAKSFFHYRGQIIRSLSADIASRDNCTGNFAIAGMLTLLLVDAQHSISAHWRCHLDGIRRIISLRGGVRSVAKSPGMEPLLRIIAFVVVLGDTSSPASDLALTPSHLDELDFLLDRFGDRIFSFNTMPTFLFTKVIRINQLRMRAASNGPTAAETLAPEAHEVLSAVGGFSVEEWAATKPASEEEWLLVGSAHKAAVALYCVHSMQSLLVLPPTPSLRETCVANAQILKDRMSEAVTMPCVNRDITWDMAVLGVEAARDASIRIFVRDQLPELSYSTGTYVPLMVKGILERFWASGNTHWDACFDRPYIFATQMSVDVSRLGPR